MHEEVKVPWVSRMICKYLWHSYKGLLNHHSAFKWLVCTRCGEQYDMIGCHRC